MNRRDFLKTTFGIGAACAIPALIGNQASSSVKTFTGDEPALFHGDLISVESAEKAFVSSEAGPQELKITGYDKDWNVKTETIVLNGAKPTTSKNQYYSVAQHAS